MSVRKFFAATSMSLALAFGAGAQTSPDAETPPAGAPKTGTSKTAAPKKSSRKKASQKKNSSRKASRKKKGAPAPVAPPKNDVGETRKGLDSMSPPPSAAAPPAHEAAAGPEDNEPPALNHTPVTAATRNRPLTISAHATDPSGIFGPILYLRKKGLPVADYIPMRMNPGISGAAGEYSVEIPARLVNVDALEYYLEVWDNAGNGPVRAGSAESPISIKLEKAKKTVVRVEPAPPVVIKEESAPPGFHTVVAREPKEAEAAVPAKPAPGPAAAAPSAEDEYSLTRFGLQLDAGAPGGAGAMLLVRPMWWLRLNAGLAYDVIGFGLRGGVTLAPGHFAVTPTLNLDAGHYFSGDANKFVTPSDPDPAVLAAEKSLLSHTTYTFASAQIGLEFGSQRRFAFYLRGGLAYLTTTVSGADLTTVANSKAGGNNTTYKLGDAKFTSVLPTAALGFLIFIY